MANILSYETLQAIKKCSINNRQFIEQIIRETEFSDFKKLVGVDIYNAIMSEIEGGISEDLQKILNDGLYACIAYLTFANYIQQSNAIDTATGLRQKNISDSEVVSLGQIKTLVIYNKNLAEEYFNSVKQSLYNHFSSCLGGGQSRQDNFYEIIGVRRKGDSCARNTEIILL